MFFSAEMDMPVGVNGHVRPIGNRRIYGASPVTGNCRMRAYHSFQAALSYCSAVAASAQQLRINRLVCQ